MKATSFLTAVLVAAYLIEDGYFWLPWLLVAIACWEAALVPAWTRFRASALGARWLGKPGDHAGA